MADVLARMKKYTEAMNDLSGRLQHLFDSVAKSYKDSTERGASKRQESVQQLLHVVNSMLNGIFTAIDSGTQIKWDGLPIEDVGGVDIFFTEFFIGAIKFIEDKFPSEVIEQYPLRDFIKTFIGDWSQGELGKRAAQTGILPPDLYLLLERAYFFWDTNSLEELNQEHYETMLTGSFFMAVDYHLSVAELFLDMDAPPEEGWSKMLDRIEYVYKVLPRSIESFVMGLQVSSNMSSLTRKEIATEALEKIDSLSVLTSQVKEKFSALGVQPNGEKYDLSLLVSNPDDSTPQLESQATRTRVIDFGSLISDQDWQGLHEMAA